MDPFQFKVVCDVCGGKAMGTHETAAHAWIKGSRIAHTDPEVCRNNLERKRKELEKMEKEILKQTAASGCSEL